MREGIIAAGVGVVLNWLVIVSERALDIVRRSLQWHRLDRTKPNKNHYHSTIRDDVVEYSSVIIISWFSLRLADDETVFGSPWSPDRPSSFRSPAKSAEVDRMLIIHSAFLATLVEIEAI